MKTKFLSDGGSNSKTAKNLRKSYILYLAPFTQNSKGINLCPKASPGCIVSCLFTAGRGAFSNVANARIKRTEAMLSNRSEFVYSVIDEMNAYARKHDGEVAIRLNGTSDIKLVEWCVGTMRHIESNIVFYDYTKVTSKAGDRILASGHRYVAALSRSETNESDVLNHLASGGIAAVVFNTIPETWNGFRVYDGDSRDDLMLDIPSGSVLALKAKGKARKDLSGFVIV
jgi:hypothetical protein